MVFVKDKHKGNSYNNETLLLQAYVVFVQEMGALWLERHVPILIAHLMELVASPKAITSHVEAVYSRKCVNFILRATLGRMIGEKAQAAACKEITQLIIKQMNNVGVYSAVCSVPGKGSTSGH